MPLYLSLRSSGLLLSTAEFFYSSLVLVSMFGLCNYSNASNIPTMPSSSNQVPFKE